MPDRLRAAFAAIFTVTLLVTGMLTATPAAAAEQQRKVAIIVGPTGSLTSTYRAMADQVAASAAAAGAIVAKAYSPAATWPKVRAAVNGASIIVYFGHGNGYPNPYSATENTDRVNGWGLNRTETNGDKDDWSTTMVYCGEKALLGTLTSSDGTHQWNWCGGKTGTDGITPAPGFVMINSQVCYAPGAGEGWDTKATKARAKARVRHYSYPALALGASAYYATDYGDAHALVGRILTNPTKRFGAMYKAGVGYDTAEPLVDVAHPDVDGRRVWVQRTRRGSAGRDYWYAFAGSPRLTPDTGMGYPPPPPTVVSTRPVAGATDASPEVRVSVTFDMPITGLSTDSFVLRDPDGFRVPAKVRWYATALKAVLIPAAPLRSATDYAASLTDAIASTAGTQFVPFSWTFRTADGEADPNVTAFKPAVPLVLKRGTHTGYRFDEFGRPTAVLTKTLTDDGQPNANRRRTVPGQSGFWYRVTSGAWKGHWLRESEAIYLADGPVPPPSDGTRVNYDPAAQLVVAPGTHTAYRFTSGVKTGQKTRTLASELVVSTTVRRSFRGETGAWFKVTSGAWTGFWLRSSDVVHLATPE